MTGFSMARCFSYGRFSVYVCGADGAVGEGRW